MKPADFIFNHYEEMIKDLETLVNLETPSVDKELLDRCADYLADYLESNLSCEVDLIENSASGNNVFARFNQESSLKPLLVLSHYDTVFPAGTIERNPFRIDSDGELAKGPGVFDMKGGIVQGLWALRALEKHGTQKRPILLLITSDEEIGSTHSRKLIEGSAKKSEAALVLEPSLDGKLKTERKGAGGIDIMIKGKASHAGLDPSRGASAIEEAARVIQFLKKLNDPSKETTVNVGRISGGTRRNVIAGETFLEVDFRVSREEEAERVMEEIRNFKPSDYRTKIEIKGGLNRPPMRKTSRTGELFALAKKIGNEFDRELEESSVGGGSDGNFCAAIGIPVLDGLGAVGDGAHSDSEVIDLHEMPVRAAILERLLEEI